MKCDVCLTPIPLGENRCPNCGFIMRTNHATTFDVSGDDHGHIELTTKDKLKKSLSNNKTVLKDIKKPQKKLPNTNHKTTTIKMIIILIGVIISIATTIIGDLESNIDDNYIFNDLTFLEVIEQDYDDGTVLKAQEFQNDFIQYLKNNNYKDIYVVEYCNQYEDEPLQAYMSIDTKKEHIQYVIDLTFSNKSLKSYRLTLTGKNNIKQDRANFPFESTQIEEISNYLGIDNCYEIFKTSYSLMELKDNEYKYTNYDHRNVYMVEDLQQANESYSYYYSIGN